MKKEWLKYDYWAKDITPSSTLRRWFHEDIPGHWEDFVVQYQKELDASSSTADFDLDYKGRKLSERQKA